MKFEKFNFKQAVLPFVTYICLLLPISQNSIAQEAKSIFQSRISTGSIAKEAPYFSQALNSSNSVKEFVDKWLESVKIPNSDLSFRNQLKATLTRLVLQTMKEQGVSYQQIQSNPKLQHELLKRLTDKLQFQPDFDKLNVSLKRSINAIFQKNGSPVTVNKVGQGEALYSILYPLPVVLLFILIGYGYYKDDQKLQKQVLTQKVVPDAKVNMKRIQNELYKEYLGMLNNKESISLIEVKDQFYLRVQEIIPEFDNDKTEGEYNLFCIGMLYNILKKQKVFMTLNEGGPQYLVNSRITKLVPGEKLLTVSFVSSDYSERKIWLDPKDSISTDQLINASLSVARTSVQRANKPIQEPIIIPTQERLNLEKYNSLTPSNELYRSISEFISNIEKNPNCDWINLTKEYYRQNLSKRTRDVLFVQRLLKAAIQVFAVNSQNNELTKYRKGEFTFNEAQSDINLRSFWGDFGIKMKETINEEDETVTLIGSFHLGTATIIDKLKGAQALNEVLKEVRHDFKHISSKK